jgi:hypothetical protein
MPEYHSLGTFPHSFRGIDDSDLERLVGENIGNSIGHIDANVISSKEGLEETEARGHRTSTHISARGGTTSKRAARTFDEGSGGDETCSGLETFPGSGLSAQSCKIDNTLSFASTTRFSLGSIIRTCLFTNCQPRMNSAAKLVTTKNRDWTRSVPNCTCIVITPRW